MTPIDTILSRLPDAKKSGKGWMARCPAHDDSTASLSVAVGDNGGVVLCCHAGCGNEAIVAAMGRTMRDLAPDTGDGHARPPGKPRKASIITYPTARDAVAVLERKHGDASALWHYHDAHGEPVGLVLRWDIAGGKKDIRPVARHADGWHVGGMPAPRPLYCLPDLAGANRVYVCEGEKAADVVRSIGLVATTSAHGAQSPAKTDWQPLAGKHVVVLPDSDVAGEKYAADVAGLCCAAGAASVRVVRLPGLAPGSGDDAVEWIEAQPDALEPDDLRRALEVMADAAPIWAATADEPLDDMTPEPPEYVPFPVDLLPSPAREYVEAAAEALGCDASYVALPLLTAMAAAIGNTRRIKLKNSWSEPCVFWTVLIGESGTMKSPALDVALEFLRRRQSAEYREFADAMRQYDRWAQAYDVDLATWKKTGHKKNDPPPEKPEPPTWGQRLAEDTTVEALAVLLENQPRGMIVARDELSGWLNSFDAYKSARGADVAHYLTMHRAGSLLVNRKGGRNLIRAPRAAVSVCGGIQPTTLATALGGRYSGDGPDAMDSPAGEHFANGLAARLLLAYPPRLAKRWTEADIGDGVRDAMRLRFDDLFDLEAPLDENGELTPIDLPLTTDAKRRWVAFYDEHAREQVELSGDLAACWSKIEGYAARFALLFSLVENPAATVVDDASMAAGIGVSRWFADEAARVYAELGGTADGPDARAKREAARLAEWIRGRGGRVTAREVQRGCRWLSESDAAEAALDALAKAGYGTWELTPTGQRGQPTRYFHLLTVSTVDSISVNAGKMAILSTVDSVDNLETQSDDSEQWGDI